MLNKLLQQQVQKYLGDATELPESFVSFIASINKTFDRYDDKIQLLQTSVEDCTIKLGELDETLLKEIEEHKKEHDKLSHIFNEVNEGFFSRDIIANKYIQVSIGCEKIYGYTVEDFYDNNILWYQVIHPDDRHLIENENGPLCLGITIKNSYRIIHKDLSIRWIEVKAVPTLAEGKLIRVEGIVNDITERKKSEAALLLNERQLDLIYNTVVDSIFMLSVESSSRFKFVSVNSSFLTTTGLSRKQVEGKYIEEVIPSPSLELALEKYTEAATEKKTVNWEETTAYPTGIKTGIVTIDPVLDEKNNCIMIIGSVHDITDRKIVEEQVKKSEQNFQNLVNTVNGIVWEANAATFQFSFVSKRAEALLGYPVSEWIESPLFWPNHIHPDDRETAVSICMQYTSERKSHEFEYRMIAADSSIVWLQDIVSVILNEDGTQFLRGIMVDITARKKSEQLINEGEEKHRSLVEQASDAIFINTPDGKLTDVNQSGCDLLGYTKEEIGQINITEIILGAEMATQASKQKLLRGEKIAFEKNILNKKGTLIPVDITVKRLSDGRVITIVRDITERRNAEKNIRESVERFQRLSQATNDAIWDWNLLTEDVWWNEGFFKLLGYDKNMPVPDLYEWTKKVHPDDRDTVIGRLRKIRKNTVNFWENEFRYEIREGVYGTVLDRAYVIRDDFGKPVRVIGAIVDITERKKTELHVAESERRYRTLFEHNLAGIFQTNIAGKIITCNQAFADILGYASPQEVLQTNAAAFYFTTTERRNLISALREQKKLYNLEVVLKTGKGKPLHVIENISLFEDPITGEEICDGMIVDISERKEAEARLKISEERYRQIVETAQEGIWVTDENDFSLFVNENMCAILEYSAEEMVGKHITYFMEEADRKIIIPALQKRRAGLSESIDLPFKTKSGKLIWTSVSASPILNKEDHFIGGLAMITDITKRKLDEALLQKSEARLESKNKELKRKNMELEQFAYVASHDLQEPLRTTSSFVKLLQQQYRGRLDEKADKYLEFIIDSSDRMKTLIKDLLDYSRIGTMKELESIDCNLVLQHVLADLYKAIGDSGAEVISEELPTISGYPTEIKQLFQNLLINAIKFSKPGVAPVIKITVDKSDGYWNFAFADNGIGIDKVHSERIFVIFQRLHTRTEYHGSGIGLSHCKKIVELHHGKIWVESVPLEGSVFHFTIPVSDGSDKMMHYY
ncbi:MAG: PAS domain S-box protein [Ferruginibacter sp.]